MKKKRPSRECSEAGIALLIAIFVLLLISVVAIALLISSGTETALGANYRSSSTVYYAALAGLEEARGRLLPKNANSLVPAQLAAGATLNISPAIQTIYITNRSTASDTVTPWDPTNSYYDNEFQQEFGTAASSTSHTGVPSVWDNDAQSIPGPLYKWVRINAATEQSIFLDVNNDGVWDNTTPLYYDPSNVAYNGSSWPSLIVNATPPSTAVQALEITALAQLPNGSRKILQYLVAPVTPNITFPAAMTLDGFSNAYYGPNAGFFQIAGNQDSSDHSCGGPMTPYPVPAIAVPDNTDVGYVINGNPGPGSTGIPPAQTGNYQGTGGTPNVLQVTMPPSLQTVQGLNQLSQTIIQNADAVIAGPATQANLPAAMSVSNPMTIAIAGNPTIPSQGNLTLSGGFTGYGLLLVTGNFLYTPDTNWNGIILVIGQGSVSTTTGGAGGSFNGAMLIAQTRNSSGNLLGTLGPATFNDSTTSTVGRGYFYNCSSILAAEQPLTYKVLSFHEIRQ